MADRLARRAGRDGLAVAALALVLLVTALWWGLALWPLPASAPGWLARTRLVCFGSPRTGLPDASGWLMLIGQPIGMLGILVAGWGRELRAGLAGLSRRTAGRLSLGGAVLGLLVGLALVAWRVRDAGEPFDPGSFTSPGSLARIDRPAPALDLVDQHGASVSLAGLRGRPVVLTFAYAHCETVCPLTVRAALEAQRQAHPADVEVIVVTLDPWRDPPSRLPAIAAAWEMGRGTHLLSGTVAEVEHALDAWNIQRERDTLTGEILHPASVLVVDRAGRIAFAVPGQARAVLAALEQLGDS